MPRDLAYGDRARRVTADPDTAVGDQEILRADLHEIGREIEHLGLELPGAMERHASGHGGRAAAAGQPGRDDGGVSDDDGYLLERYTELVRGGLSRGRLLALPVRHLAI